MNKRLYNTLDLDQTHIHIAKKIISTSQKPQTLLLSSLSKRNHNIQTTIDNYSDMFEKANGNQFKSIENHQMNHQKDMKKKKTEFGISKGRLEIISNLLKTEKTRKTLNEDTIITDKYLRSKRSKKQFPLTTFNLPDTLQAQEEDKPSSKHLPSQNSQKQNKEKIGVHLRKIKPFDVRSNNSGLNTIRYSSLLRTINNQKLYQNYSTKLPDISYSKKNQTLVAKSVFKRVQFA